MRKIIPCAPDARPDPAASFVNEQTLLKTVVPVCRRTIKAWRDEGYIPFVAIGRRILYDPHSVREALLRRQRGGDA